MMFPMAILVIAALVARRHMDFYLVCVAFIYNLVETNHFGWNLGPASDAEMVADGICFLLLALAFKGVVINVTSTNPPLINEEALRNIREGRKFKTEEK